MQPVGGAAAAAVLGLLSKQRADEIALTGMGEQD